MRSTSAARKFEINWVDTGWREELKQNITTVHDLENYLPLSHDERKDLQEVADRHPMNIPRYYLNLIDPNDPDDPIRKLAVPETDELILAGDMGIGGIGEDTQGARGVGEDGGSEFLTRVEIDEEGAAGVGAVV